MLFLLLTWQLNKPSDIAPLVIPAEAGIQQLQGLCWIALKLHYVPGSPLRCGRNDEFSCRINHKKIEQSETTLRNSAVRYSIFYGSLFI
jgi:hypothetical protein